MDFITSTINSVYVGLFGFFVVPGILLALFWSGFVAKRLIDYYRDYRKLLINWNRNPDEFYNDLFNCKIKLVLYSFFLAIVLPELVTIFSYSTGLLIFNYRPTLGLNSFILQNISLNCPEFGGEVWEFELVNPIIAFFMGLGDVAICLTLILLIGLLKFIFLAYQSINNYKSVKNFLITYSFFPPFLLVLSIAPHTQILSKILTPAIMIYLIKLLLQHKKQYFLILKWRCDDAFILREESSYARHSQVRRNSKLSFNLLFASFIFFAITMCINKFSSLAAMLLTEQSKLVMRAFNLDLNLAFLDCRFQNVIYKIEYVADLINPFLALVGSVLYSLPLFGVTLGFLVFTLYRKAKPRQTRFDGNASYLSSNA